jgi:hypothetical protein
MENYRKAKMHEQINRELATQIEERERRLANERVAKQ